VVSAFVDFSHAPKQKGYQDFTQTVVLQPGQTQIIRVTMDKAAKGPMASDAELATIKINVNPSRAAVFVDGRFVGHVGEFGGLGWAMQVAPGVTPYPDRTSV
jgi:hypothetical protein